MQPESSDALKSELRSNRKKLYAVGGAALFALVFGSVFYHIVEHLSWLDAFYFCTITLATVGYGDITPHTDLGKLFTIFYVFLGIGLIGAFANQLFKNQSTRRAIREIKHPKRTHR